MNTEHLAQLQRWHSDSFGWAMSCCHRNREEAEDVLHDAYLKCVDGRAKYSGKSSLKTWFFGVIRLTAMEYTRKAARRGHLALVVARDEPENAPSADIQMIEIDEAQLFLNCLKQLPQRQQQVMHLVLYQDLTLEETADAMDISIGSARTHYHRGKERLRDILKGVRDD